MEKEILLVGKGMGDKALRRLRKDFEKFHQSNKQRPKLITTKSKVV